MELKLMMEKLGAPQTHLGLKNMIKEVDEDFDGKLSFREVRHTFPTHQVLFIQTNNSSKLYILKAERYVIYSDLLLHPDLHVCKLDCLVPIK